MLGRDVRGRPLEPPRPALCFQRYTFGYIDLPENLRIFAQLEGEPGSFTCDQDVELTVGPIGSSRDGQPLISYKFRKV